MRTTRFVRFTLALVLAVATAALGGGCYHSTIPPTTPTAVVKCPESTPTNFTLTEFELTDADHPPPSENMTRDERNRLTDQLDRANQVTDALTQTLSALTRDRFGEFRSVDTQYPSPDGVQIVSAVYTTVRFEKPVTNEEVEKYLSSLDMTVATVDEAKTYVALLPHQWMPPFVAFEYDTGGGVNATCLEYSTVGLPYMAPCDPQIAHRAKKPEVRWVVQWPARTDFLARFATRH